MLLCLASMIGPPGSFQIFAPYLVLAALVLIPRIYRGKPETTVAGLSVREWADLADCGYPPRDAAIGVWGIVASKGGSFLRTASLGATFVGGAIALAHFALAVGSGALTVLPLAASAAYCHTLVHALGNPGASLAGTLVRIRHEGRSGLGAFPPLSHLRYMGPSGCLLAFLIFAAICATRLVALSPVASAGAGAAVGAGLGIVSRRNSLRKASENMDALERDVRAVMEAAVRSVRAEDMK